MSSYEHRVSPSGVESHRIRYRHAGRNVAKTFHTEAGARSWKAVLDTLGHDKAVEMLTAAPDPEPAMTVAQVVEHYIATQTGITDGTRARYRRLLLNHIAPSIGAVLITDLTRDHVAAWINAQQGVRGKTIMNRYSLLSSALGASVESGRIPANPATRHKIGSADHEDEEHVYLEVEEAARLVALIPEHYRPLVTLLLGTGVRWGEATALQVADINARAGTIRIRRAWKAGGALGAPKSRRSRRTVKASPGVMAILAPLLVGRGPEEFVFTNRRGSWIRSGTFHTRAWQPAARALEREIGKKPRIHDLRHTWASYQLGRGIPVHVVSRQLGHESIKTTYDVYSHLIPSDLTAVMDASDALIGGVRQIGPTQ